MKIVVNDTNIFIDLYSVGLLEQFFELPIEVHTVDFVVNELKDPEQFKAVNEFVKNGKLKVQNFDATDLIDIIDLQSKVGGNLSIIDCAVWHYAKINNYALLTGDGRLRKRAIETNTTVKGIVYVFDYLVETKILSPQLAITKIQNLMNINVRLPKTIIQERIEIWRSM